MSEERAVYRIDHQRPTPLPVTTPVVDDDGVRWLVRVMVELSRRFIGHAVKRYPEFGSQKHECPRCGARN